MPSPELLEVAIGLAVVYFLLSLFAAGIQEGLTLVFGWRAYHLELALRDILDPPEGRRDVGPGQIGLKRVLNWFKDSRLGQELRNFIGARKAVARQGLQKEFFSHPLIKGLSKPGKSPSYIPSRTFALALFDTFMQAGRTEETSSAETNGSGTDIVEQPGKSRDLQQYAKRTFKEFEAGIKTINNDSLKQALLAILNDAKAETDQWDKALANARTSLERWFDDSMDRLSGWYKRSSQLLQFFIGIGLAILFSADTVVIATTLWHEPVLRQAIVARAEEIVSSPEGEEASGGGPAIDIDGARKMLEELGLPLGLSADRFPTTDDIERKGLLGAWATKVFGWIITGFAAALGSNFWFDLLNKFVNLRASGKKPERAAAESG